MFIPLELHDEANSVSSEHMAAKADNTACVIYCVKAALLTAVEWRNEDMEL
jgi:hypothetical protein